MTASQRTGAQLPTRQGFHWWDGFGPISIVVESFPCWDFTGTRILESRELPFNVGYLTARESHRRNQERHASRLTRSSWVLLPAQPPLLTSITSMSLFFLLVVLTATTCFPAPWTWSHHSLDATATKLALPQLLCWGCGITLHQLKEFFFLYPVSCSAIFGVLCSVITST